MKNIYLAFIIMLAAIIATSCNAPNSGYANDNKDSVIKAEKIIKWLKSGKNVVLKNKTISGNLDFTKAYPVNKNIQVSSAYVNTELNFINCVFEDSVSAFNIDKDGVTSVTIFERNVCFLNCEFSKGVIFKQSDFRGRANFDQCQFRGPVSFDGANFRTGTSFCSSNFHGEVSFVSAVFNGRTNFLKTFFRETLMCQFTKFNDYTMFADSYFYGYTEFSKVYAPCTIDFTNAKFLGRSLFTNSTYVGGLKINKCEFKQGLSIIDNMFMRTLEMFRASIDGTVIYKNNIFVSEPNFSEIQHGDNYTIDNSNNTLIQQTILKSTL